MVDDVADSIVDFMISRLAEMQVGRRTNANGSSSYKGRFSSAANPVLSS